jgi:SAM-dependent methyltransferase
MRLADGRELDQEHIWKHGFTARSQMPDFDWNEKCWGEAYDWSTRGEEWSEAWGTSEAQWFGSIFPRIHRFIPASSILEIAPGFGRWTKFLLPTCQHYLGIDLSKECIKACKSSFESYKYATFYKNDGRSLSFAQNNHYDLIFSFDSLVHVEIDILDVYVAQCIGKLTENGVAFIHHSNLLEFGEMPGYFHLRAPSVSAELVENSVQNNGGQILVQEKINWGGDMLHDCLTLFSRVGSKWTNNATMLNNPRFMDEADIIKNVHKHYGSGISAKT